MKENIFSNFYTKVLNFFTSGRNEGESTRDTASNRLKLVLMQDRSNLDGATMQKMREQLIQVISKYIEIDTESLDLNLEGDGEEIALMLNIPVIRARTREEIEDIEAREEEAKRAEIEAALKAQETAEESPEETESEENIESPESETADQQEHPDESQEHNENSSEENNEEEQDTNKGEENTESAEDNEESAESNEDKSEDKQKKQKRNKQ